MPTQMPFRPVQLLVVLLVAATTMQAAQASQLPQNPLVVQLLQATARPPEPNFSRAPSDPPDAWQETTISLQ